MSIKITRKYKSVAGVAPFTYTWTADNSCVTITPATGSFTTEFETTFEFLNPECITSTNFTLSINDSKGCYYSQPVVFTNPCLDLVVNEISKVDNNVFSIYANQDSHYEWIYDSNLYSGIVNNNQITLTPKYTTTPTEDSILMCVVNSIYGCEVVKTYRISYENIAIEDIIVPLQLDCVTKKGDVTVDYPVVEGVDWGTISFVLPPKVLVYSRNRSRVVFQVSNYPDNGESNQEVIIRYTVKNYEGIMSRENKIILYITDCSTLDLPTAYSPNINLSSTDVGTTGETPVVKKPEVYINTFVPVVGSGQTLVNSKQMTTPFAVVTINEQKVVYTLTGPVTGKSELIQYTVIDSNGNVSKVVQFTVAWIAIPKPVAPLTPLVLCTECGKSTPYIDYSKYATGNVDPQSVKINTYPNIGTLSQYNSGTISFKSNNVFMAGNSFTYYVSDYDGVQSDNFGTVNVINRCSGIPDNVITNISCGSLAFNLESLSSGYISSPRLWEDYDGAYTAAGGVITNNTGAGGVNFNGLPTGTYRFKQTNTFVNTGTPINCKEEYVSIFEIYLGSQAATIGQITASIHINNEWSFFIPVTSGTVLAQEVSVSLNNATSSTVVTVDQTGILFDLILVENSSNEVDVTITDACGNTSFRTITVLT